MRIQNNITADNSHRQLGINNRNIASNTEKLSSGYRVNRAADDAAGLAISEKMRTQIRGLNRASLNIQDGVSLLQVGDGALQFVHNKMQRLRELAVQAANDTNQLIDREAIQMEFGQLASEVNAVLSQTNFNDKLLFDGSMAPGWEYNLGNMTTPYVTTIPATGEYTSTTVEGWSTPDAMTTYGPVPAGLAGRIPTLTTGMFAMQIVTPADGTFNVVIDFSKENPGGSMSLDGFLDYFVKEFNALSEFHTGEKLLDNIRFENNRFLFDFPRDNTDTYLTGVMGRPPANEPVADLNRPRVHIGVGGVSPNQTDPLNGTEFMGVLPNVQGTPGPFRANYPMLSEGGPALNILDFQTNNREILGGTTGVFGIPSAASRASLPGSVFPSVTLEIDGNKTKVPLAPGNYPNAGSFVSANRSAFEAAGFNLDEDAGKLVITAKGSNASPAVSIEFTPTELAVAFGFGGTIDISTEQLPGNDLWIQSGANKGDGIMIGIPHLSTRSLGLSILRPLDERSIEEGGYAHINELGADGYRPEGKADVAGDPMEYSLDVTSHEKASSALAVLTNAINIISTERARIGAQQNRLEAAMGNVDNTAENLQAAESRIRDVDMASEMTSFVQNQILQQSSTAMLAQANALPNSMLQLLG